MLTNYLVGEVGLFSQILIRISYLLVIVVTSVAQPLFAADSVDGVWRDIDERSFRAAATRQIVPQKYRTVELDWSILDPLLAAAPAESLGRPVTSTTILTLPLPDGGFGRFHIEESPVMAPELAVKFPEIKTYRGQGLDDPTATVRMDRNPSGFHAMIRSASGTVFIDPYSRGDTTRYISFHKRDYLRPAGSQPPICRVESHSAQSLAPPQSSASRIDGSQKRPNGDMLRIYRLALATAGEFTVLHGGVAGAMAQVVLAVNRVTGIYETELAIRLMLVANNNLIIYPDPATDPYTAPSDDGATAAENQTAIDTVIQSANYDIGHLFFASGGGVVTGNMCLAGEKAMGVTGDNSPMPGDPFWVDFVAHEMGHQFTASHTWNGNAGACTAAQHIADSAYEPGSASTILGYAGICGAQDLQPNSDAYFHARSYDQILAWIDANPGCGTAVASGNTAPTAEAGAAFTIPISTPFELCGVGTDADALTYGWEQFDLGPQGAPGAPTGNAPIFRSFTPVVSPCRTFPRLADLLANTTDIGETLPTYARNLVFRLTTRDNQAGGGGVNHDNTTLTVHDTTTPFLVTDPNTAETWAGATLENVAWDVSSTNLAPINCNAVNVALSNDGGNNYQLNLLSNTPNDGVESAFVPSFNTATGRIRVRCANNIFFDVSNANVTINPDVGCVTDLALATQTLTDAQYFEARTTISNAAATAFVVSNTGAATMRTSGTMTFRNGFRVQTGGRFTAQVVPGICPP